MLLFTKYFSTATANDEDRRKPSSASLDAMMHKFASLEKRTLATAAVHKQKENNEHVSPSTTTNTSRQSAKAFDWSSIDTYKEAFASIGVPAAVPDDTAFGDFVGPNGQSMHPVPNSATESATPAGPAQHVEHWESAHIGVKNIQIQNGNNFGQDVAHAGISQTTFGYPAHASSLSFGSDQWNSSNGMNLPGDEFGEYASSPSPPNHYQHLPLPTALSSNGSMPTNSTQVSFTGYPSANPSSQNSSITASLTNSSPQSYVVGAISDSAALPGISSSFYDAVPSYGSGVDIAHSNGLLKVPSSSWRASSSPSVPTAHSSLNSVSVLPSNNTTFVNGKEEFEAFGDFSSFSANVQLQENNSGLGTIHPTQTSGYGNVSASLPSAPAATQPSSTAAEIDQWGDFSNVPARPSILTRSGEEAITPSSFATAKIIPTGADAVTSSNSHQEDERIYSSPVAHNPASSMPSHSSSALPSPHSSPALASLFASPIMPEQNVIPSPSPSLYSETMTSSLETTSFPQEKQTHSEGQSHTEATTPVIEYDKEKQAKSSAAPNHRSHVEKTKKASSKAKEASSATHWQKHALQQCHSHIQEGLPGLHPLRSLHITSHILQFINNSLQVV